MRHGWKREQLGGLCDILDSQRRPVTKRDRTAGKYPYYGATGIVDYVTDFIFDAPLVLVGEDGAKWQWSMNEAETSAQHIDPALKAAGWGVVAGSRIRREYPISPEITP